MSSAWKSLSEALCLACALGLVLLMIASAVEGWNSSLETLHPTPLRWEDGPQWLNVEKLLFEPPDKRKGQPKAGGHIISVYDPRQTLSIYEAGGAGGCAANRLLHE